MKTYTTEELDALGDEQIPFPYIEKQLIWGHEVLLYVDNYRSEDWYGYRGWFRKVRDSKRAWDLLSKTHSGIQTRIKVGDTAFDCGANEGYTTVLMSRFVGPSGKVIAFEPDPKNVDVIRRNLELNGLQDQVTIVQKAVSNVSGAKVYFGAEMIQGKETDLEVETVTLDEYVSYRPNFIKIDVEGYELPLLQGASRVLDVCRTLEIELHLSHTSGVHMKHSYGFDPDEIYRIMRNSGYDVKYQGRDVKDGEEPQGCVYCTKIKQEK